MKKFLSLGFVMILISLFLVSPAKALTASDVYYQLSTDPAPLQKLYVKSEVCKVTNCLTAGAPTDWYNYSTTSENIPGDSGAIQTLTVKPGDTVTFKNSTWYNKLASDDEFSIEGEQSLQKNVLYGVKFTNDSNLTLGDIFSNGLQDIDGDANLLNYFNASYIYLTNPLVSGHDPEVGGITATINPNVPDGTIITETFYVVSINEFGGMAPNRALAATAGDNFVRSTVQLQVSNPAPTKEILGTTTTTTTTTVPTTGADTKSEWLYIILPMILIAVVGTAYVVKYAKR